MICSLLNREVGFLFRSVLQFLDRSISRAMGCFIGCFRIRDDRRRPGPRLVSQPSRSNATREAVASRNPLSSLFLSEENETTPEKVGGNPCPRSPTNDKELRDEAKFLKACGALPETPAEIRKASEKFKVQSPCDRGSDSSKFHSWLPNASIEKIQLNVEPHQLPTPAKLSEDWKMRSVALEHTPRSRLSNAQTTSQTSVDSNEGGSASNAQMLSGSITNQTENFASSVTPFPPATDLQHRNKTVHFECDVGSSSSDSSSEYASRKIKKVDSPGNENVHTLSPYPTPLKLSDECKTPGTVFPMALETLPNGRPQVRSQFVYVGSQQVKNTSELKVLEKDDSSEHHLNATSKADMEMKETLSEEESRGDEIPSAWLKPPPSTQGNNQKFGTASSRVHHFHKSPGDRPIIGMVAAHWCQEEPSHVSSKWWDGNGIPNSTNKYKEDQKVSWHATPFEERLEKALSQESFISQRKSILGKPIVFDVNEESDTAQSRLQSSTQQKSVVSF